MRIVVLGIGTGSLHHYQFHVANWTIAWFRICLVTFAFHRTVVGGRVFFMHRACGIAVHVLLVLAIVVVMLVIRTTCGESEQGYGH